MAFWVCFVVYLSLAIINFAIVYKGPLSEIFKKDNVDFTESFKNLKDLTEPIIWPSLAVCKVPIFKNPQNYAQFLKKGRIWFSEKFENEAEFEKLKKDTFFIEANEIIHAMALGSTFIEALGDK